MVNAADAGALAAARECGLARGEGSARQAAGELVADNNDAATVTGFQIDPDPAVCSGASNPGNIPIWVCAKPGDNASAQTAPPTVRLID